MPPDEALVFRARDSQKQAEVAAVLLAGVLRESLVVLGCFVTRRSSSAVQSD
jgi:hypothetical protein